MKRQDRIEVTDCKANPSTIYVFGDNLIKKGKAGQAIIRDESNAFGIPTKRLPSMSKQAFFSDKIDEIKAVQVRLDKLSELGKQGVKIVLPSNKIGSGLAKLWEKSPKIASMIDKLYGNTKEQEIKDMFEINRFDKSILGYQTLQSLKLR